MALVQPTILRIDSYKDDATLITWGPLVQPSLSDGAAISMPGAADRCVQVTGTLGAGGNVRIEGSNLAAPRTAAQDGTFADWNVLTDPQGNALDLASLRIEQITEITRWIRPRITGGDGTTSLTVRLLVRRPPT
jgi:hypothetical protein